MTLGSRALCLLHLTITPWLAIAATLTHDTVPAWATAAMAAASLTPVIAIWRERDLRHERRHVAALIERQIREEYRRNGRPLNQVEQAVFQRLAASVELPGPDEPRSNAT